MLPKASYLLQGTKPSGVYLIGASDDKEDALEGASDILRFFWPWDTISVLKVTWNPILPKDVTYLTIFKWSDEDWSYCGSFDCSTKAKDYGAFLVKHYALRLITPSVVRVRFNTVSTLSNKDVPKFRI